MPLMKSKSKKAFSHNVSEEMEAGKPQDQSLAIAYSMKRKAKNKYAYGGKVADMSDMSPSSSITDSIMRKRKEKMMAEGGMVDIEENGEEMPNSFDEMNEDAIKKELYDDSQLSPQPMDSNEDGDMLSDEDSHDMVSMIRRKMRMKQGS